MFSGSDFPYLYEIAINYFNVFPNLWSNIAGNGFGQNVSFILGLNTFFFPLINVLTEVFGFNWFLVEKVIFIIPFFLIAFSSTYLFSSLFLEGKVLRIIASIIFSTNTYALMIVGGGQFGVSIAYAVTPLVLYFLIKTINDKKGIKSGNFLISILVLSFQILIDPRLALISIFAGFIYLILSISLKTIKYSKIFNFLILVLTSLLINSFWIVPFIFSRDLNLSAAYTSSEISSFFSFAKLENTIALIHPNYPENIFGKVGFLKPEYLILPLIAFSSSLFIKKKKRDGQVHLIFLLIISLFGIFLAKGTNYPLGSIYTFILDYVPFATIYRDPMKFYLLIALGFSILIPFSLNEIGKFIDKKTNKKLFINLLLVIFIGFWFLSIRHLFILGSSGVFNPTTPDEDYFKFAKIVSSENEFSRTVSVPTKQRFIYNSQLNPAVNLNDYLDEYDSEDLIKLISSEEFIKELRNASVKYVVLPYDQDKEIFLEDRKFSQKLYDKYLDSLNGNTGLIKLNEFSNLNVFQIKDFSPLISSPVKNVEVKYNYINPVNYEVVVRDASGGEDLIFNQSYSSNWVLISDNGNEQGAEVSGKFNKFNIERDGIYKIYYKSQKLVYYGLLISVITFAILIGFLFNILVNKRKK